MRCRYRPDIERFLRCLFFLFLLDLLTFRNLLVHQIGKIDHTDIRHIGRQVFQILRPDIHHHIPIRKGPIVHGIKSLLHTVGADTDILRKMYHLSGLTLRPVTNKAHILMDILILILCAFVLFSIVN